ncbi:hypothetical protein A2U01_0081449 [Trifolium medium]|uniref:Uncharacterized protein n=1 Tax=Trifolium medium TaxID=97028 RepID=A0A392THX2_9FABA|nr:hypothetical protein [Trifolium medium]
MDQNGGKSGNFAWGEKSCAWGENPKVVERDLSGNFAWGEKSCVWGENLLSRQFHSFTWGEKAAPGAKNAVK